MADHRRVQVVGFLAVLKAQLVGLVDMLLVGFLRPGDLVHPGAALLTPDHILQGLQEQCLVTDHTQVQRPVATQVSLVGVYPDGRDARTQAVLAGAGHAVLADKYHQVGAEQGVRRRHDAQAVIIRKGAPGGAGGGNR